jgi:hypothetical protein
LGVKGFARIMCNPEIMVYWLFIMIGLVVFVVWLIGKAADEAKKPKPNNYPPYTAFRARQAKDN